MKINLEHLQAFYDESKTWNISIPVQGCNPTFPLLDNLVVNAICCSGKASTRSDAIALFSETVNKVVEEDKTLGEDLHWLAVAASQAFRINQRSGDNSWIVALDRWYYSDSPNIQKILRDDIQWLSIMQQYLLRETLKRLGLDFEDRTSLLKEIIYSYKKLSWSAYAKKKYSYQCWGEGDVHLYLDWNQQDWAIDGFTQTKTCLKNLFEEQLVFENFSHYNITSLESILGSDALKLLPVWSAADQSALRIEYESAISDLGNFREVVARSDIGGAMRQNKFETTLRCGRFEVKISLSDTGKGVLALKKTKDALESAAGYGVSAAAVCAIVACPIVLAALPIAAIATGGFGGDKKVGA